MPLRYSAARFASKVPTWRLPPSGRVPDLVTDGGEEVGIVRVEQCDQDCLDDRAGAYCLHYSFGVDWVSGPGGSGKRVRLNRQNSRTPCESRFVGFRISSTSVQEIESLRSTHLRKC